MLADRLLFLRQKGNLTQEAVADAIGITVRTYIRYEKGEREPVASLLSVIADFYGVTADYLLGRSNTP